MYKGKLPTIEPEVGAEGLDAIPGDAPFILHEDGLGWIYVPKGLKDGPFPTHYEPLESPVSNELYSRDTNPPEHWFPRSENRFAPPGDSRFPFVLTTYRLTEHHTAGGMSRFLSHLAELQPEMFAEISPELARERKISNGDHICIVTLRAAIEARALVSRRIRPLHLNGKTVHQIALPYHYGTAGLVRGGAANDLLTISGEPNVTIMEAKACTCNIVPGRLPRGQAFAEFLNKYAPQNRPASSTSRGTAARHDCARRRPRDGRKRMKAPGVVEARPPDASKLWDASRRRTGGPSIPDLMIGEGTHSTNQRRHNYVRENVEVALFPIPALRVVEKNLESAVALGFGKQNASAVIKALEKEAGVEVNGARRGLINRTSPAAQAMMSPLEEAQYTACCQVVSTVNLPVVAASCSPGWKLTAPLLLSRRRD